MYTLFCSAKHLWLKRSLAPLAGLLLVGCSSSLVVEGEFPRPMVDKLPLTLGVHYEDDFRRYVYQEESEDRISWTIDSGQAQTLLFNTVLPNMFEKVVMVDALPQPVDNRAVLETAPTTEDSPRQDSTEDTANNADSPWDEAPVTGGKETDSKETGNKEASALPAADATPESELERPAAPATQTPAIALGEFDLLLSPRVDDFQYAMPRETKINVYEIWIKYNMRVYNRDGQLIADWIMSAYGKTPTAFMKSREEAMNEAVVMALRDIGASLSLGFRRVPEIRAWLEQHKKAMISNSGAAKNSEHSNNKATI